MCSQKKKLKQGLKNMLGALNSFLSFSQRSVWKINCSKYGFSNKSFHGCYLKNNQPVDAFSPGVRDLQVQQDRMGNLAHKKSIYLTKRAAKKAAKKLIKEAKIKKTTVEELKAKKEPRPEQPFLVASYMASCCKSGQLDQLKSIKGGAWRELLFPHVKLNPNKVNTRIPKYIRKDDLPEDLKPVEVLESAPFLKNCISSTEAVTVFETLPSVIGKASDNPDLVALKSKASMQYQVDALKKLVSLDHASQAEKVKFDIQRLMQLFQRRDGDCGSSEVQAAVLTVKILNYDRHLATNKKDHAMRRKREMCYHKRRRVLRYLRRVDLEKYVLCCKAFGIDPTTIY